MEHKIISSRRSGEGWQIKCSCGWSTRAWRWLAEERFLDHSTPTPNIYNEEKPKPTAAEFPNGEFKDEYYARQGDLRFIV